MESVLLLGVFHSRKFDERIAGTEPNRGQGFRDGVRSKALEDAGYIVKSLDNKHSEEVKLGEEIHCNANFADARRMSKALKSSFGESVAFDHIILDYFFSPIGWARERWTANFWRNTIPMLAENEILVKGGKLWLPNLDCVQCSIDDFRAEIEKYYVIEAVEDPNLNPLYAATENVETELLRCPDHLTNETQLRPLLIYSKTPFLTLSRREVPLATCVTPSGRAVSRLSVDHKIVPTNLSKTNLELASAPVRNTLSKSKSKQLKSPSKRKTSVSQEVKIEEEEASAPPMSPTKRRIASVVTPPRIKAPVQ